MKSGFFLLPKKITALVADNLNLIDLMRFAATNKALTKKLEQAGHFEKRFQRYFSQDYLNLKKRRTPVVSWYEALKIGIERSESCSFNFMKEISALYDNDVELFKTCLIQNKHIAYFIIEYSNVISLAAQRGNQKICDLVYEYMTQKFPDKPLTLLMIAIATHQKIGTIQKYLPKNVNIHARLQEMYKDSCCMKFIIMQEAIVAGHKEAIQYFYNLDNNIRVEYALGFSPLHGFTPLHTVCCLGDVDLLSMMSTNSAFAETLMLRDRYNETPVSNLCRHGHLKAIQFLIENNHHAAFLVKDNIEFEYVALKAALFQLDVFKYLIAVIPEFKDLISTDKRLLLHACKEESCDVVEYLLQNGADVFVNCVSDYDWTPHKDCLGDKMPQPRHQTINM